MPDFGYDAPAPFREQPLEIQQNGFLNSDLCTYKDQDGEHYFIRACLEVPIRGMEEPFVWGVWSSLSKKSFDRYVNTYESPDTKDCYFGWLCNRLPCYPDTYAIKLDVHPRTGGTRPYVVPERTEHPLSIDFHDGITSERAVEIAEQLLHANDA
jgi:hypothetical protein